ncbi:MAG: hypothetical protein M4D80_02615 [Myxococcota bacterium]|nr:hypothetical protein [Deltaproteobacteria bacterium]MDQ3334026.1 hypothetical protein [Myxococcota bacterium]
MRWPWVFAIATAASPALARTEPPVRAAAANVDFWKEMIDPNADEVAAIVTKVRELLMRPDHALNGDTDWAVDQRAKFFRDAKNMLVHARKLSPQNAEVLALLGRASDELGDTKAAIEALEACVRVTGLDKIPIDVAGRLGAIQMRIGDVDAALKWLRLAQAPLSLVSAPSIVNLASALAEKGDTAKAIDTLVSAIPPSMLGNFSNDVTLASFALAVLYDRDEQRAAAFAVLDQMQSGLGQQYAIFVQNELAKLRFPHAEDLHYYRGLLYESVGQYVEARAEWAHYAAAGATPWRARALAHVAAIDAQRRANPGAPPTPLAPGVPNSRRRHP